MSKNARLKMEDFKVGGGKAIFLQSSFDLSPAIENITMRIRNVRESLNGRPLVVLMGEDHRISSHVLLQFLVLMAAHKEFGSQVGFATELPYNIGEGMLLRRGHSEGEVRGMLAADVDGQLTLREIMNEGVSIDAKYSRATIWGNCLSKRISTCFADAAMSPDDAMYLDHQDEYNLLFMRQHRSEGLRHLHSQSPIGVNLRNMFIAARVKSHIQNTGLKIIFMGVGAAHVFGLHQKYDFSESLACQFDSAGIPFLAILPFGKEITIHHIPSAARNFFAKTIAVKNMDERAFPNTNLKGEIGYIQRILSESGSVSRMGVLTPV